MKTKSNNLSTESNKLIANSLAKTFNQKSYLFSMLAMFLYTVAQAGNKPSSDIPAYNLYCQEVVPGGGPSQDQYMKKPNPAKTVIINLAQTKASMAADLGDSSMGITIPEISINSLNGHKIVSIKSPPITMERDYKNEMTVDRKGFAQELLDLMDDQAPQIWTFKNTMDPGKTSKLVCADNDMLTKKLVDAIRETNKNLKINDV
jgi:hypothetical protein